MNLQRGKFVTDKRKDLFMHCIVLLGKSLISSGKAFNKELDRFFKDDFKVGAQETPWKHFNGQSLCGKWGS